MNKDIFSVAEFMLAAQQTVRIVPTSSPSPAEIALRLDLIAEELMEMAEACGCRMEIKTDCAANPRVDLIKLLDALTDLRYVLYGAYATYGLAHLADPAFEEVHSSNMSKVVDGQLIRNAAGKVQKPATYFPPNLKQFLPHVLPQ